MHEVSSGRIGRNRTRNGNFQGTKVAVDCTAQWWRRCRYLEVFETEDIQNGNGGRSFSTFVNDMIDSSHQPGEKRTVEGFGERVSGVQCLIYVQRREQSLVSGFLHINFIIVSVNLVEGCHDL